MHPVIAEILDWKRGAQVKPVDQARWQEALRELDATLPAPPVFTAVTSTTAPLTLTITKQDDPV